MQNEQAAPVTETAPPGWEDVVSRMQGHPEITEAHKVAWWLHDRGAKPQHESGMPYQALALWKRYEHGRKRDVARETNGAGALGAVLRDGAKHRESAAVALTQQRVCEWSHIREAGGEPTDDVIPVVLLAEGPGNARDHYYYTADAIQRSAHIFEGAPCFLDHASTAEEDSRPERSVRDKCGWYSRARAEIVDGKAAIVADLHLGKNAAAREARDIIATDRDYRRQYPDKVWAGFSINAAGHAEPGEIDGAYYKVVRSLEQAASSDLVTFPGAGGKALSFREAGAVMESRHFRATFASLLAREAA